MEKTTAVKAGKAFGERGFLGDESGLSIYMREISKTRKLTSAEEADLAARIKQGDMHALNTLVTANLKFVVAVSRNYRDRGLPWTDLINEGNLGLIRAAKSFDASRNFRFISYAVWWIRQSILAALAGNSRVVNVPLSRVKTIYNLRVEGRRLEQKLGRAINPGEIPSSAAAFRVDSDYHYLDTRPVSLDAHPEWVERSLADALWEGSGTENPDYEIAAGWVLKRIMLVLDTLEPREREVVKLYFGVGHDTRYSLEQIAVRFGLTRERVRQIKETALGRLKRANRAKQLQPLWYS